MSLQDALKANTAVRLLLRAALGVKDDPKACPVCQEYGYVWWICPPHHKGMKCKDHR